MTVPLTLVLAFGGFGALCTSMPRHYRQVTGTSASPSPASRCLAWLAGVLLLTASIVPCVTRWATAFGLTAWFGCLTIAAIALALCLTYAARHLKLLLGANLVATLPLVLVYWSTFP